METPSRFCPHCGCKLEFADAKFCSACGGALGGETKENNSAPATLAGVPQTRQPMRVVGSNPPSASSSKTGSYLRLVILLIIAGIVFWICINNGVFDRWLGPDKDRLALQVRTTMQDELDTNPRFREYGKLTVEKVFLTKTATHQYNGIATIRRGNKASDVHVDVSVDGDSLMWRIPPLEMTRLLMDE